MVVLWLGLLLLALVFLLLLRSLRRPHNFPPGPVWLPVVGNLPQLRRMVRQHGTHDSALLRLSQEHGTAVLGLRLGGELVVYICSHSLVHLALRKEEFNSRPDTFFSRLRSMGTRKGITFVDGPLWREHRQFVTRHLRQLGFGKQPMEEVIAEELQQLTAQLEVAAVTGGGMQPSRHLAISVLNVLLALIAGKRFKHTDPQLLHILEMMERRARCFDSVGGMLSLMPWLRHLLPGRTGYSLLLQLNAEMSQVLKNMISEHRNTYNSNETRDLIDAFLKEMENNSDESSTFTDDQLLMMCADLFIAGSQTTSTAISFALLMMLLRPDIQSKVHAEIDSVLGMEQLPTSDHQNRMPYTYSVLLEVERMYPVVPMAGPRRAMVDTTFEGYNIPKDTTVLISLQSLHMDKEHWGDPEVFRPERFIDSSGAVTIDNWHLAFGLGKRRCLGEALAKSCLFIFFTGILQKFQILRVPGEELPSDKPVPGITLSPQPFSVLLRPMSSIAA